MQASTDKLTEIAKNVRRDLVWMSYNSKVGHLGSALSIVDIIVVLYYYVLSVHPHKPNHPKRDRFILSKGHAAAALYAVLSGKGFFPKKWLETYCKDAGHLGTHPDHAKVPGVEWTTGSLGHGLSVGVGIALVLKIKQKSERVVVLISDAESQEGEIWEAAMTAAHHKLGNLTVIVDYNKVQAFGKVKNVLGLEPFADKWRSFGWQVIEVDGHIHQKLIRACDRARAIKRKPTVIIAHTIRGKGIAFMEHKIEWYYKAANESEYQKALEALS